MAKTTRSRSRSSDGGKGRSSEIKKQRTSIKPPGVPSPWPIEDPTKETQAWPQGLLFGLDDVIWAALAHVPLDAFQRDVLKPKQQPVIREALKLIGLDWVATNNQGYRVAMGKPRGKYWSARAIHVSNGWQPPPKPLPVITKVDVDDNILPKEAEFTNISDPNGIRTVIEQYGVAVIRSLFSSEVGGEELEEGKTKIKLAETKGDGVAGGDVDDEGAYYAEVKAKKWTRLQNDMLGIFLTGEDLNNAKKNRKVIVLHYREGAENWAHRDALKDNEKANSAAKDNAENSCAAKTFPFQAAVMVSKPGVDFTGGDFYVASRDADSGRFVRTKVAFKNPGDVVMFRADSKGQFDHGMLPVRRGSSAKCERVAIGLFQKK